MKTRYQMTRLGQAMDQAIAVSEKPLIPSKNWSRFDDIEAAFYARQRPAPAPAPAPVPIPVSKSPLLFEEGLFFIPFNPPRFKMTKNGPREEKMAMRFLGAECGPLKFKVLEKTDPARILEMARKLSRFATDSDVKSLTAAAMEFIIEPPKEKPAIPAPSVNVPASGICNRFRKGAFEEQRITHRPAKRPDWYNDLQTANDWTAE